MNPHALGPPSESFASAGPSTSHGATTASTNPAAPASITSSHLRDVTALQPSVKPWRNGRRLSGVGSTSSTRIRNRIATSASDVAALNSIVHPGPTTATTKGRLPAASTKPRSVTDPVSSSTPNASAIGAMALPNRVVAVARNRSRNSRSRSAPSPGRGMPKA